MIIGNFTYSKAQDSYTGELSTLTAGARKLVFQPGEAKTDKAPDYRVIGPSKTGDVEFGAAWKKRSEEGRDYLSVKLDDLALAQLLNCAVMASNDGEGFILVWSRDSRKEFGITSGRRAARRSCPSWRCKGSSHRWERRHRRREFWKQFVSRNINTLTEKAGRLNGWFFTRPPSAPPLPVRPYRLRGNQPPWRHDPGKDIVAVPYP
jgi:uncharacterized protein (DUF736 family)